MSEAIILFPIAFLYGILIGSFLNVCTLRIPAGESVVTGRSHCDQCKTLIKWYDLIPIISYFILRGKCRNCKTKISIQYPFIEALNGFLYVLVFYIHGWNLISVVYCLVMSALIVLSVIDLRTNTIPFGINIFIFALGLILLYIDRQNLISHIIGFFVVSIFLLCIYFITKGRGIGGGDIKLMAAAGIVLGWKLILLAFCLGCIYGAVIHPIRMKRSKLDRVLAFGPYLSAGIISALLFGEPLINWYIDTFILI
jgi:leader peptidase (prepilin peptidase)/N-methyltransferase